MIVSNAISEAVLGRGIVLEGFLEELTENLLVKLAIFIGSVAIAGYFTIMFSKELWAIVFSKVAVT